MDTQEDIIQYQTTSFDVSSTQQGSSAVQHALPDKTAASNTPKVNYINT